MAHTSPLASPNLSNPAPTPRPSPAGVKAQTMVMLVGMALLALYAVTPFFKNSLILNTSSSLPQGVYRPIPLELTRGALVVATLPSQIQDFMISRGWIAASQPSLKRIIALPGDTITRTDNTFLINGEPFGLVAQADSLGRALPQFLLPGTTYTVPEGQILLGTSHPRSFDSRYYGPIPLSCLISGATTVILWDSPHFPAP